MPTRPSGSALRQARQRLGVAPLKALFDLVRGPAAAQARWCGLLVVAVHGTLMPVPDTPENLTVYAKQQCHGGSGGYPQIRPAALVACGTRAVNARGPAIDRTIYKATISVSMLTTDP